MMAAPASWVVQRDRTPRQSPAPTPSSCPHSGTAALDLNGAEAYIWPWKHEGGAAAAPRARVFVNPQELTGLSANSGARRVPSMVL